MKNKLFLLAVIMAFIGCSDDDDKGTPNDALTEYPVNFSYSASFLGSDLFNESNPYLYSSTNDKYSMGLGELRVYDNMGKEYLVYDNACPYEWDKNTEYSSLKAFNTDKQSKHFIAVEI